MAKRQFGKNWFERNSKKTIFFILIVAISCMALVSEKILALRPAGRDYRVGVTRYIKLREVPPLYSELLYPTADNLKMSDGLEVKTYLFRADENGFIIPAKVHQHPDLTMAFLGGSTTECIYVEEKNRFAYRSGHLLEEKLHLKINSLNGAKSGNDSLHSINILVNKLIPLKPDIVVMMHNINDLSVLLYDNSYWTDQQYRSPLLVKPPNRKTLGKDIEEIFHLTRDLTIPNLARAFKKFSAWFGGGKVDEFAHIRGKKITINKPYLLGEFKMNQQTFVDICRARHITPVLMTMANRLKDTPDAFILNTTMKQIEQAQGIKYGEYKEIFDLFNQAIREVGAQNQVLVIDLAKEIPQENTYLCDLVHYNDHGCRLAASVISENLEPLVTSLIQAREKDHLARAPKEEALVN